MNLLLLDETDVRPDGTAALGPAAVDHIRKVLKLGEGDSVRVGLINGPRGVATIEAAAEHRVILRCVFEPQPPERPRVDVLLALPRPKVLRRLWAQLAALGVGRVILTNADKVERDYFDSHVMKEEGYRPLLIEGLQQARDTHVPVVTVHKRFRVLIEEELDGLCPAGRRVVAHPGSETRIGAALQGIRPAERVLLAIGPEGGWNAFELRLLEAHQFQTVGVGQRILTTTTATVALLALVHEAMAAGAQHH